MNTPRSRGGPPPRPADYDPFSYMDETGEPSAYDPEYPQLVQEGKDDEYNAWFVSFATQVQDGDIGKWDESKKANSIAQRKSDNKRAKEYDIASGVLGLGLGIGRLNPIGGIVGSLAPQVAKKAQFAGNMDMGYGRAGSPDQFKNPSEREDYYRTDSQSSAPPAQIIAPKMP
jgi:hypothetical protein